MSIAERAGIAIALDKENKDSSDGEDVDDDGDGKRGMEVGGGVDPAVKETADQALAEVMEKTTITATCKDGNDPY